MVLVIDGVELRKIRGVTSAGICMNIDRMRYDIRRHCWRLSGVRLELVCVETE